MPFRIIVEHVEGTLKDIADAEGIEYSKGRGYYELTKKESISAKKELVLWKDRRAVSDDIASIRQLCGVSMGEVKMSPSDVPTGHKLFVQSTSPNRKIADDVAVLFSVAEGDDSDDDKGNSSENEADGPDRSSKRPRGDSTFALKFEDLIEEVASKAGEIDDEDLGPFFNVPIGTQWSDCDCNVPKDIQMQSLWQITQLSQAEWTSVNITTAQQDRHGDDGKKGESISVITSISAEGTLNLFPSPRDGEDDDEADGSNNDVPVRLEYRENGGDGPYSLSVNMYMMSIGNIWAGVVGVRSMLPFVVTNEIQSSASDDGNGFHHPLVLMDKGLSDTQRLEAVWGNIVTNFLKGCRNWN
jgi:hypothetical protein